MLKRIPLFVGVLLVACWGEPAAADTDPTLHQVYEAIEAGHVDRAREMMQQVLRDHPASGKAHYVAAEVDAKAGDFPAARRELGEAERLSPGLPFAKEASVRELREELEARVRSGAPLAVAPSRSGIPWGLIALFGLVAIAVVAFLRRRQAPPASTFGAGPGTLMPAPAGTPGGYPPAGPAAGPGLMGSVASGLAVGAGVVAGEEIARRLLDSGHHAERIVDEPRIDPNADVGGNDFGVTGGDSWDDGGSLGGGDDWN